MKIIGRTLAILAAALVVVGITFAVAQPSAAAQGQPAAVAGSAASAVEAGQGAPPAHFEREGARGPSLFGALEVLKNLVVVGAIVAFGALAAWVRRRRRGRARRSPATFNATPAG